MEVCVMEKETVKDLKPIMLGEPAFENGGTLFEALKARRTSRAIGGRKISRQVLSDLLWAAQGVNRREGPFGIPGLTAGSASNSQEIRVYAAMEEGIYLYEPEGHKLTPVAAGDKRAMAIGPGQGRAGVEAPVRFIYVVDIDKFETAGFQEPGLQDTEIQKSYYYVDTGLVAQNVCLAASSLGLASWFHNCDRARVKQELGLGPHEIALFGHTAGYAEDRADGAV
jgi:hypothetical protein